MPRGRDEIYEVLRPYLLQTEGDRLIALPFPKGDLIPVLT